MSHMDDIILSPGAKPIAPPIKGIDSSRIYKLRNVPDTDKIKAVVDSKKINKCSCHRRRIHWNRDGRKP